jgi:predicted transcriptional regulator
MKNVENLIENKKIVALSSELFDFVKLGNIPLYKMMNRINDCYRELDNNEKERYDVFFDVIVTSLEANEEKINKNTLFAECYRKTKYSYSITSILCKESYLKHSTLASMLKIKVNQLSNIIKILLAYKLIDSQKVGREKYYFITDLGEEFYKHYSKNFILLDLENKKKELLEV